MERWVCKVALVTGAGSGIGAAIAVTLAQAGMKVVGIDLNQQAVQKLSEDLSPGQGSILALKCDVTIDAEVEGVFDTIQKQYGGVDVCINNAGAVIYNTLLDGTPAEWRKISNLNVVALCHCSKLATQSMVERKVEGQIINICSMFGHRTTVPGPLQFYAATKHAVKFLTEGLRQEMIERKHNIRVVCISPSHVNTRTNQQEHFQVYGDCNKLEPENVSNAIKYILSLPQNVEMNDMLLAAPTRR